jgi:hypothetical protein
LDETYRKPLAGRAAEPARAEKDGGIATEIPLTGEERTAIERPFKAGGRLVQWPLLP